jgi:CRP/FNR family cyclic AMP-dependent transcriptional regulator
METEPFLAGLDAAEWERLRELGRRRRWPAGATLFNEGDRARSVIVLLGGRVKVYSLTDQGTEIVLAVRGPGALLGEMSMLDDAPRAASVVALEPLEGLEVRTSAFALFLNEHPNAAAQMVQTIVARLRDADRKRVEFGAHDTQGRVALRLVELAERYGVSAGNGIRIALPFTQEELAGWIGSSRESVAKALRTLRDGGMIETHRKGMSVLDLDGLRARAR